MELFVKRSLTITCCCLSWFIFSQKSISNQMHGWALYTGTHKITPKWSVMTEYQWRRADGFRHWQQSLLRFGVEYALNPKVSVMGGLAWIQTFPYGSQPILHKFDEYRIYEQINLKDKIGVFEIQHRFRVEQRWLEQYAKNNSGEIVKVDPVYRNRLRYRCMVIMPLPIKNMFLNVNNELFIGVGKGIALNPIDQNRFIAALGWRCNDQSNIQIGYLNQFVIKSNAVDMERNHTLWLSLVYNLDFTKKEN